MTTTDFEAMPPYRTRWAQVWPRSAIVVVYVAAVAVAQAVAAFASPLGGAIVNAVLLVVLLEHRVLCLQRGFTPARDRMAGALGVLALLPLLGLLSLALALDRTSVWAYLVVGVPALLATVMAAPALEPRRTVRDWAGARPWRQASVAVCGIPLGLGGFVLLDPAPVSGSSGAVALLAEGLVVFLFVGVIEEVVFRGLIQRSLGRVLGGVPGTVAAAVLFATVYLGSGSAEAVAFFGALGALASWWVYRTGELAGVAVAHGLLSAGLLAIWPALI